MKMKKDYIFPAIMIDGVDANEKIANNIEIDSSQFGNEYFDEEDED